MYSSCQQLATKIFFACYIFFIRKISESLKKHTWKPNVKTSRYTVICASQIVSLSTALPNARRYGEKNRCCLLFPLYFTVHAVLRTGYVYYKCNCDPLNSFYVSRKTIGSVDPSLGTCPFWPSQSCFLCTSSTGAPSPLLFHRIFCALFHFSLGCDAEEGC